MNARQVVVLSVCLVGLAWTGGPTQAQSEKAVPCAIDFVLRSGSTIDSIMFVNPILLLDEDESTDFVSVYTVRGAGFYSLTDGTTNDGRLIIVEGRWSSALNDINRFIEVRALNGPLKGRNYELDVVRVVSGNISESIWIELTDGMPSGQLAGSTDCNAS